MRQVEIVVRAGPPPLALRVVDMCSGRHVGLLKSLDFKMDVVRGVACAKLSYLKLEGSPDGTVPPDHPDRVVAAVDEKGVTELIEEEVEVVRFATYPSAERQKRSAPESATRHQG